MATLFLRQAEGEKRDEDLFRRDVSSPPGCRSVVYLYAMPGEFLSLVRESLWLHERDLLVVRFVVSAIQETKEKRLVQADQQSGFGLGDLQFALRFPLRESLSLVGLSILFGAGLFSLPFFRLSGVGLLLGSIGLLPAFIAHALLFGCASLIIQRLESGRTDSVDIFDVTPLIAEFWEAMRITAGIFGVTGLPLVFALQYGFSSPSLSWLLLAWSAGYYPVALAVASISKSFFPS